MLGWFKGNIAVIMMLLPVFAVLWWYPGKEDFAGTGEWQTSPLYNLIHWSLPGMWWSGMWGILFVVGGAVLLNYVFNSYEFMDRQSFMTGLLFVSAAGLSPIILSFHPVLPATLLLVFAAGILIGIRQGLPSLKRVINACLLIGVASLIYWPSLVFLPISWFYLGVIRPFVWREWFWTLIAALIPWIWLVGISFVITGSWPSPIDLIQLPQERISISWNGLQTGLVILLGLLLVSGLFFFIGSLRKNSLRFRRIMTVQVFSWMWFSVLFLAAIFFDLGMAFLFMGSIPMGLFLGWFLVRNNLPLAHDLLAYTWLLMIFVKTWSDYF